MTRKLLLLAALIAVPVGAAYAEEGDAPAAKTSPMQDEGEGVMAGWGWGVFAGYYQGARVSQLEPQGVPIELPGSPFIGYMMYRDNSPRWRFEGRAALSKTKVENTYNGDVDALLHFLDLNAIPHWQWGKTDIGFPFGIGWAGLRSSGRYADQIPGRNPGVTLQDGSGMTVNAGVQARWKLGAKWSLVADARYHKFHRLVNVTETRVRSVDVSIGFTKPF